jgi:hypothetical protein
MVTAQVVNAITTLKGGTRSRSAGPTNASMAKINAATMTVTFQIRRTVLAVSRWDRLYTPDSHKAAVMASQRTEMVIVGCDEALTTFK